MKPEGQKHDEGKLRYDLVPAEWTEADAQVMTHGAQKYEPDSWRGVEPERYEAALMRHFIAHRKGEYLDSESGLPHLHHVAVNAKILTSLLQQEGHIPVSPSISQRIGYKNH